jgi:biopolymer transport protein ExbB
VPAVLGYNWLIRRNKDVNEKINNFSADVHGALVSGSRIAQPVMAKPVVAPAAR